MRLNVSAWSIRSPMPTGVGCFFLGGPRKRVTVYVPRSVHANKAELLMVLDRPEIPLHTNGSENDIRCQVTKRKISGGTRSGTGRDCRDAFLALAKTCGKLGIAFWDYLGSRLAIPGQPEIPYLPSIVRHRCASG